MPCDLAVGVEYSHHTSQGVGQVLILTDTARAGLSPNKARRVTTSKKATASQVRMLLHRRRSPSRPFSGMRLGRVCWLQGSLLSLLDGHVDPFQQLVEP